MKTLCIAFLGAVCFLFACNLQTSRDQVQKGKKTVTSKPDSAEAYKRVSYLEQSDFDSELDKVLVEFKKTVQVDPRAETYKNLGASYLELGKLDKAVVAFKKAVQIDSSFVEAHYLLADVYSIKGEGVLSRKSLDQAMALDGSYIIDISTVESASTIELPPMLVPRPIKMDIPHRWRKP